MMIIGMCAVAGKGLSVDTSGLTIIAMIGMGLFTYLTWIPMGFFILACLAAFGAFILSRRAY